LLLLLLLRARGYAEQFINLCIKQSVLVVLLLVACPPRRHAAAAAAAAVPAAARCELQEASPVTRLMQQDWRQRQQLQQRHEPAN
jgi:hypothetical protein